MSPNGEQYCLLHLLGDLSTVQNLSCPDVMKCNVLDSWIQSLSCENLVMTEVKKPSNRPLVLSDAAAALQYKDHQPTCLHPITWSTMHLSNSGKLSLILSVKTVSVKHISRSNKKFLTVHVSNMKNLLIWSHPSVALSQGATSSTVSWFFFFFWADEADSFHSCPHQHLLSDSKDTKCCQHLLGAGLDITDNAELT